jgi:hypothetical protein
MNHYTEDSVVQLNSLDYDNVEALKNWCIDANRYGGVRETNHRKQLAEARAPKILAWLKDHLQPGMKLKMKGCRDGHGLRQFIRWDRYGNLVCWQINIGRKWTRGYIKVPEEVGTQVTTHMPDKVVKVWVEKVDGFSPVSILDLIK